MSENYLTVGELAKILAELPQDVYVSGNDVHNIVICEKKPVDTYGTIVIKPDSYQYIGYISCGWEKDGEERYNTF